MIRTVMSLAIVLLVSTTAAALPAARPVSDGVLSAAALSLPGEWAAPAQWALAMDLPPGHAAKTSAPVLSPAQLSLPGEVDEDLLAPHPLKTPQPAVPHCQSK